MRRLQTLEIALVESLSGLEIVDVKLFHLAPGYNVLLAPQTIVEDVSVGLVDVDVELPHDVLRILLAGALLLVDVPRVLTDGIHIAQSEAGNCVRTRPQTQKQTNLLCDVLFQHLHVLLIRPAARPLLQLVDVANNLELQLLGLSAQTNIVSMVE